jgi:SAM-dependent methyltransferase
MKRAAERLFDFPALYRAKFLFTGALMRLVKPVIFHTYFTLDEVLARNIPPNSSVLEIGCGDGANFRLMETKGLVARFCGLDVNPNMIEHCRTRHPAQQWLIAAHPPYPTSGDQFDISLIVNVLHHLESRDMILEVLREAATQGKQVVLFEPLQSENFFLYWLKRLYWLVSDGGNLYLRREEFSRLFADAGLVVSWEAISAPLMHFYAARLTKAESIAA